MFNLIHDAKNDPEYSLGTNVGYFAAFLLFASVFYFILNFLNKLPETARYYHVLLLVIIIYVVRLAVLKLK
ncbi:hypothetical protein CMO83_05550 [Candidatus Woesearchaeota archaeon]|jgi:hypothetical protein|nr:hypothetical protein [Candidatus Woesearchaeota archaeon]MDP6647846.1 hypothetical protein [Candidatus Woesearchaeota archaeon]|tara:strand:- start:20270 stop:20482 length:213 start_codon:yes stop_codon:yes gene_type:complete